MKRQLHLWASTGILLGMCAAQAALAAGRSEIYECQLKYKKNEASVPMKEFKDCFDRFSERKAEVELIQMHASTHNTGNAKKNTELGNKRIDNLRKLLLADYPEARIDALNLGASLRRGDVVRLTTVAVKAEKATAMEEGGAPVTTEDRPLHTTAGVGKESGDVQVETPHAEELPRVALGPTVKAEETRENFGRIAARMGQDADRDTDESFPAIGFEVAYVRPNTGTPNLRTEMGGTAVSMSKGSELMRRASAHFLLGAGYNISGIVVGARALGGGVWDEQEKWRDDFGGEGRLGFENGQVSIFAGIGRTDKTSRFGLDVGLVL